jgi:GcrA cell cycle regulator
LTRAVVAVFLIAGQESLRITGMDLAPTEFRETLGALGLAQHRLARLFGVGARSIRRWRRGDRRTPCGVGIVLRLLATGAVSIDQVEQAAQTNGSVKPRPLAPVRTNGSAVSLFVEPSRAEVATLAEKVIALAPGTCRYPCGDPRDPGFHFCGDSVTEEPYCKYHHTIAYLARS